MPIHNADIAAIFNEIADLLEIEQANPFRIRAYRNAARLLTELEGDVRAMVEDGEDLTQLPGIGKDLAGKISEIVASGRCQALDRLRSELPPAISELLHVPGLGSKRVRLLWRELDVQSPQQLLQAARDGRIRDIPGFGARTEAHILQTVEAHLSQDRRIPLAGRSTGQAARCLACPGAGGRAHRDCRQLPPPPRYRRRPRYSRRDRGGQRCHAALRCLPRGGRSAGAGPKAW